MRHTRERRGRGFTVIELIVIVVIVLFILAMLLTTTCGSTERANRVKCASNLKQIGMGMLLYSNDNRNVAPRVRADAEGGVGRGFTGAGATNPFAADGPVVNDPTAALFLLVRGADLNPEVFVCPSSNQEKDTLAGLPAVQRSNFSGPMNL